MNLKIKAALTVLVGISAMSIVSLAILSIPEEWIKKWGLTAMQIAVMVVGLYFCYQMALDYYRAKQALEEMKKGDSKK